MNLLARLARALRLRHRPGDATAHDVDVPVIWLPATASEVPACRGGQPPVRHQPVESAAEDTAEDVESEVSLVDDERLVRDPEAPLFSDGAAPPPPPADEPRQQRDPRAGRPADPQHGRAEHPRGWDERWDS